MNFKLLFLCLFLTQIISAQTFTEVTVGAEFEGVDSGSIAFADVDGDNDVDVLITGRGVFFFNEIVAKLYLNDGQGNFTELSGTPFEGVFLSSIAFSDVDGDNDSDVLITGQTSSFSSITKLYINDGQGNFSEMMGTPFEAVRRSSIAFSDVDGDNDSDVLITGGGQLGRIAKLYTNDGLGNFMEVTGTPFEGVENSSIAFSDVDGDNDQDVLITGTNDAFSATRITKLYTNDGQGNFIEVVGTPFVDVEAGSIAFADVDGDSDSDVLITGAISFNERISKLYTNDGLGNFTEMPETPFDDVGLSSITFADVDGDNDPDVLITGINNASDRIAKLYTNDGQGNFIEITDTPFEGVDNSSIAFADVDSDNDPDVLITGQTTLATSKLYTNDFLSSADELTPGFNFALTPYPNPTAVNILKVGFNAIENGVVNVKVYDLNGMLLSQQKEFTEVGPQDILVDVGGLSAGSYFIQLNDGNRIEVAKFVVL